MDSAPKKKLKRTDQVEFEANGSNGLLDSDSSSIGGWMKK